MLVVSCFFKKIYFIDTELLLFRASFIFIVTPWWDSLCNVLNSSGKFPHSKTGWNIQHCLSSPLEGCLTGIDCSASDLHFCASLIRWKNGERKYIQSYPLWQSCEQSHSFSFRLMLSPLFPDCQANRHTARQAWIAVRLLFARLLMWSGHYIA